MYLIGLTGGIASGKSTVSRLLSSLGAFIVDADKLSREVTEPGKPAYQDIIDTFGKNIIQANGEIDRKQLGKLVFASSKARLELEQITHPRIEAATKEAIVAAKANGFTVAVLDAPLLIEVGWHTKVDSVWVVYVDKETQLVRLMERDKCDNVTAQARINAQLPLEEKLKYADIVINNNDSIETTQNRVLQAWGLIAAPQNGCNWK